MLSGMPGPVPVSTPPSRPSAGPAPSTIPLPSAMHPPRQQTWFKPDLPLHLFFQTDETHRVGKQTERQSQQLNFLVRRSGGGGHGLGRWASTRHCARRFSGRGHRSVGWAHFGSKKSVSRTTVVLWDRLRRIWKGSGTVNPPRLAGGTGNRSELLPCRVSHPAGP